MMMAYFYMWMFLKLAAGFALILAYLNFSGRTQLSQMNAVDVIGNFTLGGIVGGVIYNPDITFLEYIGSLLVGIIILLIVNFLCRRYDLLRNVAIGRPIPIMKNGRFLMENIMSQKNKVDMLNVASQLNIQGIHSFDDIYYAQLEPNGSLTAICDRKKLPSEIICYEGNLIEDALKNSGKTERAVLQDMKRQGITDISDVFLGEFKDGNFRYISMDGTVYPKRYVAKKRRRKKPAK